VFRRLKEGEEDVVRVWSEASSVIPIGPIRSGNGFAELDRCTNPEIAQDQ
jgi:hypothetical protein